MEVTKKILVLIGPTGSGKTALSELIAKQLPIEIISADSRQIYKHLDIGTAKPPAELLKKIKHHFIDALEPGEDFNAGEFSVQGRKIIEEIFIRKKTPLVLCGTGLYLRALVDGIFEGPAADDELRDTLLYRYATEGGEKLLNELRSVDAQAAAKMLPSNKLRIVRALEVFMLTGKPISQIQQEQTKPGNFTPVMFGLDWERKILYSRINKRVTQMLEDGFLDEVKRILAMGISPKLNSLQTVGYKEAFQYLNNEITYERFIELMKQNSRRYAKRQLTWFRRNERIEWLPITPDTDFNTVTEKIIKGVKDRP